MRGKRWIASALVLTVLISFHFWYRRSVQTQLETGFDNWTARIRPLGWDVRYGSVTREGWPESAVLRVNRLTITTSDVAGSGFLSLGCDTALLRIKLLRPDILEITPTGPLSLRFSDRPPIPITAERLLVRLPLRPDGSVDTLDAGADGVTVVLPGLGVLALRSFNLHADHVPSALTFAISAGQIALPESRYWTIGQDITAIVLEGVLNGPMTNEPGLAAQARFWRDGGGSLDVSRLTVDWGATRLDATATLALDDDLQPMGAGTGKLMGYGVALDALAANGVFRHSAVQAAKAVLSLLASTSAEGKPEVVDVPLSLQFRTLSVHQVPLVRFPELEWSGR